jgi:hypothetical protein
MNKAIELKQALMQLPLEAPLQSEWLTVQKKLSGKATWQKWAWASVASAALALVIFMPNLMTQPNHSVIASQQSEPLEKLLKQSAQLENSYYAQQDDSISSATVIAANLAIEDQLNAIDLQLSQQTSHADSLALWQARIDILNEGVRLNKTNAAFNAEGRNYDLTLASIN